MSFEGVSQGPLTSILLAEQLASQALITGMEWNGMELLT